MKFSELKGLSQEELKKKQRELELELLKARAQSVRGTVAKNPHQIAGIRQNLVRIATLISSKSTDLNTKGGPKNA
jgi:ribosomal protein L29